MIRTGTAKSKSGYSVPTYECEPGEAPTSILRFFLQPVEISRHAPASSAVWVSDNPVDRVLAIVVEDGTPWYVTAAPVIDVEMN